MNLLDRTEEFKSLLQSRLKPERYYHSLCVADCAVELAELYGVDKDKAFIAGLLHDITKNENRDIQLQRLEKSGIILNQLEKANHKLYHSMSGSIFIRTELGIDDEDIINAVRYHTTGRAGMSVLEKVIYIADYISAERDYPDVETMRALAKVSLEKASLFSLRYSLTDLSANERIIHPDSLAFYNELILSGEKV